METNTAKSIIEGSGNSFHARIVRLLRAKGWKVLVSPYYSDNFTDKPREIDIICEKEIPVKNFMGRPIGFLKPRLFIECKYIAKDIVFWFDTKDKGKAAEIVVDGAGLGHPSRYSQTQKHHYLQNENVAKLFATNSGKGNDEGNEVISRAINQNLNAFVYYREKEGLLPSLERHFEVAQRQISYPLIIVNSFDKFHRTFMDNSAPEGEPIDKPFQLEVNYAYVDDNRKSHHEYFLIDVVSEGTLEEFLKNLEETDFEIVIDSMVDEEDLKEDLDNSPDSSEGFFGQ